MQEVIQFNNKDVLTMKLLHYFITCCGYSPVIVHGVENEIWLENLNTDSKYKIIRIVSNYIHNEEQYRYDILKTKGIVRNIKRKTLNLSMNVLSIFIDLNEDVKIRDEKNIDFVSLKEESDLNKYKFLYDYFPNINENMKFNEKGVELFIKITNDINKNNKKNSDLAEEIFKPKKIYLTYILIFINSLIFLYGFFQGKSNYLVQEFSNYGPYIRNGEFYRLFTGGFIHVDLIHLFCNMWSLYIIGSQIETFFGKTKFLIIYFFSMLSGSLLSILLNNHASIGASGALFGLMGALVYFGYNYRIYLGNALKTRILPVIILNLAIGFMSSGIDNFAHIGGLIGGFLITSALGIKTREENNSRIHSVIITILFIAFLLYMNFVVKG